jgi:hypothetical protein
MTLHLELCPWSIIEYSPEYTNNILKPSQTRMIIGYHVTDCNIKLVHCNPLICMVMVEDKPNNYDASTLIILSSEYNRLFHNT